ncbi:MAG: DUF484 family protein [Burkholderiaceae bacterium]|nr:DUF484 family protein [Rhodoferax sp.]MCP5262892.1 DUF484 family protein [Rhodoferax sp.]MCW5641777.1 DUF484 family protein [Rhodoferax sp.]
MTDTFTNPITEDDIANYLANTPDFFERHAELLASVHLTSPHSKRAVSLQERQAEMLRDKIKVLEHRLMDMIRHGNENALLSDRLLRWSASLFENTSAAAIPAQIVDHVREQFSVPQVTIKVWGVAEAYKNADFATGVSEDAKLFATSLSEPFCGVNTGFEAVTWLAEPAAAASIALLPLRDTRAGAMQPAFGMLVLSSPDGQRYNSGMGTDFLQHVADIASAALGRLRQD